MTAEYERAFDLFGSRVRILIGAPQSPHLSDPAFMGLRLEAMLKGMHTELTRFDSASRLSLFNRDPAESVAVGNLVATLVRCGIEAAEASGGLVDFTILGPLEDAGYVESRVGAQPAPVVDALAVAPTRRPATGDPDQTWKSFVVDSDGDRIERPPGLRIDGGGIVKGLAADLAAAQLGDFSSFAIDCGGDLRIGGTAGLPRRVDVENPLSPGQGVSFEVTRGGVATSGVGNRVWASRDGYAHHLIDPGTGRPAWTGIVQATAFAETAREAEVRAKAAFLSGPEAARFELADRGGVLVLDSGELEVIGKVEAVARNLPVAS